VDGLFISPVYRFEAEARIYQEILASKIPTVLLGPPATFCRSFVSVEIEELLASQDATQHLISLGHKRIAYLTGPPVAPWAHERFEGYRRALREAGLELDDKLVFQSGSTIEDGTIAALQMLNEGCKATAVQAVSDLVAIGCANALLSQGLKIPEDVSIVGFGNILAAEYFQVPLTTIRQPKHRLGVAAVETMMALLRGEKVQPKRLPAELVHRKSSAPPKS
jgi:LacI family transcriptional regulator